MKRLPVIAAAGVLALVVTACSGNTSGNGSSSTPATGTSSAAAGGSGSTPAGASSSSAGGGSASSPGSSAPGPQGSGTESPSSSAGGGNFAEGKTFTMVISADPGNLDPLMTSLSSALQVDRFLYDSLINITPDGQMVAGLAEKWDGDASQATYTLRKGVTCSDGTPLTATTIADNINFVGDPKNQSTRIGVFVPPGATATADDAAGTVTVKSPSPDAFLVRNVGGLQIVCAKGTADRTILAQGADGTGMFTVQEAVPSDHYTLTRRKDYAWGPGDWNVDQPGLPDTVVIKVVQNETTGSNLLLSGDANYVQLVGPDQQRLAAAVPFHRDLTAPLGELWFNHKAGQPGADEPVRAALTQALDLEQLGKVLTSGNGQPATGLVAPGMTPCPGNTVQGNLPAHDVDAAKAALDAAGWKAGGDGVRSKDGKQLAITLYYPTSLGPTMQSGAELMQASWTAVGAAVTIKPMTDTEAATIILSGQGSWDAAIIPLGVTLPSQLVPFLSGPSAPDGQNFSAIDNQDYSDAVAKAQAQPGDAGCSDWNAAEVALFQHVDMVPFVNSVVPAFGKGATFEFTQGSLDPTSIRMLA
jgi:peptide/nickel transport system substrate-binding protein